MTKLIDYGCAKPPPVTVAPTLNVNINSTVITPLSVNINHTILMTHSLTTEPSMTGITHSDKEVLNESFCQYKIAAIF